MAVPTTTGFGLKLRHALASILLPTLLVSGGTGAYLGIRHYLEQQRRVDPTYTVKALVQRCAGPCLPTALLIELLNLSTDSPTNLYNFSTTHAEQRLLALGVFSEVQITKVFPDTITIDYRLREPIAYIQNTSNTALSSDGIIMPFHPFFTPKKIPQIRLNELGIWGQPLPNHDHQWLMDTIVFLTFQLREAGHSIEYIDFTKMQESLEEIAIYTTYGTKKRWLRMTRPELKQNITNYKKLLTYLNSWEDKNKSTSTLIDLRVPEAAYFSATN